MINLLPPQQKIEIQNKRKFTLLLIWEFLIFLFFISLILILLLVKIYIEKEIIEREIILAEKEKAIKLNEALEKKIEAFNLSLTKIHRFYQEQKNFTKILEKIFETLPSGIYLTNINFAAPEKEPILVFLSGFSPNRETLLSFKKNLEHRPDFFEVYFPIESWIIPENINFTITFKLK